MNISVDNYIYSIISYCLIVLEARASKIRSSGSELKELIVFLHLRLYPYFFRNFKKINNKYVYLIAFSPRIKD
jgi:hypothetical protein